MHSRERTFIALFFLANSTGSRVVKKNKNEKTETTEQAAQETSASGKGKKNGKKRPNAEERKEVSNSGGYAEEGSTETYVPPVKKKSKY